MNYSQVTVDILQNPKYAGAIDSVSWLTNWIDSGFGMVITIVAFLIILVAMFKTYWRLPTVLILSFGIVWMQHIRKWRASAGFSSSRIPL